MAAASDDGLHAVDDGFFGGCSLDLFYKGCSLYGVRGPLGERRTVMDQPHGAQTAAAEMSFRCTKRNFET